MPYKSEDARREASRKSMEKKRGINIEGVNKEGLTGETIQGLTSFFRDDVEMVPASFVEGLNGKMYQFLPERPRFLTLSDGQVLDRLLPTGGYRTG